MKKGMKLKVLMGIVGCFALSTSLVVNATELSSSSENEIISTTISTSESDSSTSDTQTSETTETAESTVSTQSTENATTETTVESDSNIYETPVATKEVTSVKTSNVGPYQSYGKYVTITSPYYATYNNFSWSERNTTKNMAGKTYLARGKYQHGNGATYLSLFDDKGNWYGYLNANATKVGDGRQGAYQSYGKHVTITNGNYSTYSNFSWSVRNATKNLNGKTYLAKGKYQHINGSTYLSLYDDKGNWYGYLNASATKVGDGRQGAYQSYGEYVTIKSNYTVYNDFSWNTIDWGSYKLLKGKTFLARGKYQHVNGSTYLSLFDVKGNWYGYVNANYTQKANAQGSYISDGDYVKITQKNYDIWQNFSWQKRSNTSKYYGQKLQAKGRYNHFNGSVYYSLYDLKNNWIGYLNINATDDWASDKWSNLAIDEFDNGHLRVCSFKSEDEVSEFVHDKSVGAGNAFEASNGVWYFIMKK